MSYSEETTEDTFEISHDGSLERLRREKKSGRYERTKIPEKYALQAAKYAINKFRQFVRSDPFQVLQETIGTRSITQLEHCELELGELLGEGSFSTVFAIKKSRSSKVPEDKFVVKTLQKAVLRQPTKFAACAIGLAKEGAVLGLLDHPHIIKLKATSQDGLWRIASGCNDAYFLVLDRLEETLSVRLERWRQCSHSVSNNRLHSLLRTDSFYKWKKLFSERLLAGTQIAAAVSYLHKHNILHRDLKPANLGFDQDGNIKLFDFNISRFLPEPTYVDETFELTMETGTRRYMSPECSLGRKYNLKSDVYSYALLLYEILSLKAPYKRLTKKEHLELVLKKGCKRPRIPHSWPSDIKNLIMISWSHDLRSRPTMKEIHDKLNDQLCQT